MAKGLKSPLRILAATSVAIFSLLSVFTATAAWFDSTRSFDNGANQMNVNTTVEVESITIHQALKATANDYYFNQNAAATYAPGQSKGSGLPMDPAEDPFSPLEPYHPVLMVINYRQSIDVATSGQVKVDATTDQGFVCKIQDQPSSQSLVQNGNPLSSIVDFFSLPYDASTALPTGTTTIAEQQVTAYHYTPSEIKTGNWTTSHFAYMDATTAHFRQNINLCTVTTGSVKKIAVVMEYSEDVISFIYGQYIGADVLDNNVGFSCDWTLYV